MNVSSSATVAEMVGSNANLSINNATSRTLQIESPDDLYASTLALKSISSAYNLDLTSSENQLSNVSSSKQSSTHSLGLDNSVQLTGQSQFASNSAISHLLGLSLSGQSSLGNLETNNWYQPISHNWTFSTFAMLRLIQPDGTFLNFLDHYYKHVHPRIPILNREWFIREMVRYVYLTFSQNVHYFCYTSCMSVAFVFPQPSNPSSLLPILITSMLYKY